MIEAALVGCGRISERHVNAISKNPRVKLAAVCDLDPVRLQQRSKIFDAEPYLSIDTLLEQHPDVGLISITVPSGYHFEVAMNLIPRRIPLLIEKPLTLSVQSALELISKSAEFDTPVFVVKQNRLNPPVAALLELAKSGSLGRILSVSASVLWARPKEYYLADTWRLKRSLDGGVIWNQASHYVDLIVQLLDQIKSVSAFGQNFLSPAETEDSVNAIFSTESNQLGSIVATTAARPNNIEGSLTVIAEAGVVRVGGHALNVLEHDSTGLIDHKFTEYRKSDVSAVYGEGHLGVYDELLDDIAGLTRSQFRASNGIPVVGLMEAIETSILEERCIKLKNGLPEVITQ